jgi:hypothetical protein
VSVRSFAAPAKSSKRFERDRRTGGCAVSDQQAGLWLPVLNGRARNENPGAGIGRFARLCDSSDLISNCKRGLI